jgi:hypothetical protein
MGADTFTATEAEVEKARIGIEMQAQAAGLDFEDPKVRRFLDQMIETTAAHLACERFQQDVIHRVTAEGHWSPDGCQHVHKPEEEV